MIKNTLFYFFIFIFFGCTNSNYKVISKKHEIYQNSNITIYAFVDDKCGYCSLLKEYFLKKNVCDNCINVIYLTENKDKEDLNCPKTIYLEEAKEFDKTLPHIKIFDNERGKIIKTIKGFWPERLEKYMVNQCVD